MPEYEYTAKKGPQEIVKSTLTADSREKAVAMVEAMGYFPVKVFEISGRPENHSQAPLTKLLKGKTTWSGSNVGAHDLDTFLWQLASLMKANVPLLHALTLLIRQTKNGTLRAVAGDLESRIRQGEQLSQAMTGHPKVFDHLTISMVRTGEKSGSLNEVLRRLADHREKEQEVRRKIQSALAYPMVVLVTGAGSLFLMFTFFLPKLTKLFSGMKQELPFATKVLMGLSAFMSRYGLWVLGALMVGGIFAARKAAARKKNPALDRWVLQMPFLNRFVKAAEMARFSRSMEMLLKNGIPVHECLPLATQTLENVVLRERISAASEAIINRGVTLSESFSRTGIFPDFLLSMISVGEESGKLEDALDQIAFSYEKEVDQTVRILVSLVEPVLILSVGAVVGFIVFAMLLPILNMGGMGK